jgi:hypothetical protein
MSYEPGAYVDLHHINGGAAHVQKKSDPAEKRDYQITFEQAGKTLRLVRHIPVSFA